MVEFVEDERVGSMPTVGERIIWKGYEWGAVLIPFLIMLSHWYIFYLFSKNTHEVLYYPEINEICIAWIYTLVYLVIPLVLLPSTFLFRWCNLFRVPFVYFIFINVERWYYGSWFCTNEMIDVHYILIYCTICIYIVELMGLWWRHRKHVQETIKDSILSIINKVKGLFGGKYESNERYAKIVKVIKEESHAEI